MWLARSRRAAVRRIALCSISAGKRSSIADRDSGKSDFTIEEQWKLKYSRPTEIKFVGVWDTVGALGIPLAGVPGFGKSNMRFLNTGLRRTNKFAAINETIDATVFERWRLDANYRPPGLVSWVERRKCQIGNLSASVRADNPLVTVA
jgi:hypothetical protein